MNITLRKANALQHSINEAIKGIEIHAAVSVNEFEDPVAVLAQAKTHALKNISRVGQLNDILYEIREAVGRANDKVGVSAKLAKAARIAKDIERFAQLAGVSASLSSAVIAGKLEKIRNTPANTRSYGYNEEVTSGVFSADEIAEFKSKVAFLKKEKQSLTDTILELNVQTTIALSDESTAVLAVENLL